MTVEHVYAPSDFVSVFNQTLDMAYPVVWIEGEISELRIRKNQWVYFNVQDDYAKVELFGSVHSMHHPIENGMMVQVRGTPKLHPLYGFSVNVQFVKPVGEGSIKKSADALMQKLKKEGLFDESRKRRIPLPVDRMALITSADSAAYHDFIKIYSERWGGTVIDVYDVRVQGEQAVKDIVSALEQCNKNRYDVVVLTRGGGSAEDLSAFSSEPVTRAVAGSDIPTVVAIGHEVDVSLAELAADLRASTPTSAAMVLSLEKKEVLLRLEEYSLEISRSTISLIAEARERLELQRVDLHQYAVQHIDKTKQEIKNAKSLLQALDPRAPLRKGYALVRSSNGELIRSGKQVSAQDTLTLELHDARVSTLVQSVENTTKKPKK